MTLKHHHLFITVFLLLVACSYKSNNDTSTRKEPPQKDTTAHRDTVKTNECIDTIDNLGFWQFCTKEELEEINKINDSICKETIVIVQPNDRLFHLTPNCRLVKVKRAKFTDANSAIKRKKTLCHDCMDELIALANKFSGGDYMWEWMDNNREYLWDYIDCYYEDFREHFHSDDEE